VVDRRLAVSLAVALVAALVGLALVLFVFGGDPRTSTAETRREAAVRAVVRATLHPPVHRFGERVTAQIELTARQAELVPESGRPTAAFEPYTALGSAREELREFGALAHLRYTVTIQCLKRACLPEGQAGEFEFGNATVEFRMPPPPGRKFRDLRRDQRRASAPWPPVKVTSWLTADDLQAARWRSNLADLPAPTFRVAPRWLVGGLLGAAVALVLVAAGLVNRYVRDLVQRRAVEHEAEGAAAPLEQALALVEASRLNGDVDGRRVALETLAYELRAGGESRLAGDAERLAWSAGAPGDAELQTLVATVRGSLDGGRS
jgi:hypothetical protein